MCLKKLKMLWICFILLIFTLISSFDDLYIPISFLFIAPALLIAAIFFVNSIVQYWKKEIKNASLNAIIGITIVILFGIPFCSFGYLYWTAKLFRLEINYEKYMALVANTTPDKNGYKFISIPWGGNSLNGVDLIYDESDEILRKINGGADQLNSSYKDCHARHLKTHFYLVYC